MPTRNPNLSGQASASDDSTRKDSALEGTSIDPSIAAVSTAYSVRQQQLAAYIESGKFPPFMVKELVAKLETVRKEQEAWEKGISRRSAHANRGQ